MTDAGKKQPEWMTQRQVAHYLQCSIATLARLRPPRHLLGASPRYLRSEIDQWVALKGEPGVEPVGVQDDKKQRDKQVDWAIRLVQMNNEASDFGADDRLVSARDYLYMAAKQLVALGESEHDDTLLLVARACQGLEDSIGTLLRPQLKAKYEAHGWEAPPALTGQESKQLLTALRTAANAIEKAAWPIVPAMKVPTTSERATAAIQCRDNIANGFAYYAMAPHYQGLAPAEYQRLTVEGAVYYLKMALSLSEGYGSRFLPNLHKHQPEERRKAFVTEAERVLTRANLTTQDGRLRAATRIVMACAIADGMTEVQAKNLFKRDPKDVQLSKVKGEQTKRVQGRD